MAAPHLFVETGHHGRAHISHPWAQSSLHGDLGSWCTHHLAHTCRSAIGPLRHAVGLQEPMLPWHMLSSQGSSIRTLVQRGPPLTACTTLRIWSSRLQRTWSSDRLLWTCQSALPPLRHTPWVTLHSAITSFVKARELCSGFTSQHSGYGDARIALPWLSMVPALDCNSMWFGSADTSQWVAKIR